MTLALDMGVAGLHPGHLDVTATLLRCGGTALVWAVLALVLLRTSRNVTTARG